MSTIFEVPELLLAILNKKYIYSFKQNFWIDYDNNLLASETTSVPSTFMYREYAGIYEALTQNEFSKREAAIYLTLLINGDAKAGDLAKELKLYRLDVYNALKNLQAKEVVVSTLSKPMLFRAVQLSKVIKILKRSHREDFRRRIAAMNDILVSAKKLDRLMIERSRASDEKRRSDRIQILSGRKSITEKWERWLSTAKDELLIATTKKGTMQSLLMQSLDSLSTRMKNEGVIVKIFTPVSFRTSRELEASGLPVRDLDASNSAGLCIMDRKRVLIVTELPEAHPADQIEETAVVIESNSIVGMMRTMFFVGWDTSPSLEQAISISNMRAEK